MMQGIEVLSTFKVVSAVTFNWEVFWWIFGGITCIFVLMGLLFLKSCHWAILPALSFIGLILGGFLVLLWVL